MLLRLAEMESLSHNHNHKLVVVAVLDSSLGIAQVRLRRDCKRLRLYRIDCVGNLIHNIYVCVFQNSSVEI